MNSVPPNQHYKRIFFPLSSLLHSACWLALQASSFMVPGSLLHFQHSYASIGRREHSLFSLYAFCLVGRFLEQGGVSLRSPLTSQPEPSHTISFKPAPGKVSGIAMIGWDSSLCWKMNHRFSWGKQGRKEKYLLGRQQRVFDTMGSSHMLNST